MLRFAQSTERWWQKPLAMADGRSMPAELLVLRAELRPGESGVWLNSRGTTSGVIDLIRGSDGKFKTVRAPIRQFASEALESLYKASGLTKGAADLIIWNESSRTVRFVEVKCPHWDHPSIDQLRFLETAKRQGFPTSVVEWEFARGDGQ